jgi:hypothetical protein
MTFKDLLDKGEGTIYLVNIKKPYKVEVYDSLIMTRGEFHERYENNGYWTYYRRPDNPEDIILKRKSHDKRNNMRNGHPRPVDFSGFCSCITLRPTELDSTSYKSWGVIAFTNKEDACDYVIDKIKRKKLEYNGMLLNANKLKFSL